MKSSQHIKKEEILKELDELFPALKNLAESTECYGDNTGTALKSFLSQALDRYAISVLEELDSRDIHIARDDTGLLSKERFDGFNAANKSWRTKKQELLTKLSK